MLEVKDMAVDLALLKLTKILFNGSCIAAGQKEKRKAAMWSPSGIPKYRMQVAQDGSMVMEES